MRGSCSVFVFESSNLEQVCLAIIISVVLCLWMHGTVVADCVTIYPSSALSGSPVCHYHLLTLLFRTICPLLLTFSLTVCLPLLQSSMQSDLCVSPACSLSFTLGCGHLGTIMPKHCHRRPENESFSLHFRETFLSSNSYNIVEKKM